MTTTDYTPEQLHALGLSEVTRIAAKMDAILKAQGMSDGSVAQRLKSLHDDPRYLLPNTDEGRKKFLARFDEILREVNATMPQYFRTVPKALLSVQRMAVATEKGSAAAQYADGAMDGSRPGIFFVNERDLHETPSFAMKTLVSGGPLYSQCVAKLHESAHMMPADARFVAPFEVVCAQNGKPRTT